MLNLQLVILPWRCLLSPIKTIILGWRNHMKPLIFDADTYPPVILLPDVTNGHNQVMDQIWLVS